MTGVQVLWTLWELLKVMCNNFMDILQPDEPLVEDEDDEGDEDDDDDKDEDDAEGKSPWRHELQKSAFMHMFHNIIMAVACACLNADLGGRSIMCVDA